MKDVRSDDETVQFFDKELVLYIESLNEHDKHVDIVRIVLAPLILALGRWCLDDTFDK